MRTFINVRLTGDQVALLRDLDSENPARALAQLAGINVVRAAFIDCQTSPATAMLELEPESFLALDAEGQRRNLKNSDIVRLRAGLPIRGHLRAAPVKEPRQEQRQADATDRSTRPAFQFPAPAGGVEWVWIPIESLELERLRIEHRELSLENAFRARLSLPPIVIFARAAPRDRIAIGFHESEYMALRRACWQGGDDLPSLVRMLAGFESAPTGELRPKAVRLYTDSEWDAFLDGADLPEQPKPKTRAWNYLDLNAA